MVIRQVSQESMRRFTNYPQSVDRSTVSSLDIEGKPFNKEIQQLSNVLDRLVELHQQEVAEARREAAAQRNAYAALESEGTGGSMHWLSEANASVPVELQTGKDDHLVGTRESTEYDVGQVDNCGIVNEAMVSLDGLGENAAVTRWARLVHQMQRPQRRVASMNSPFVTLPVWFIANRERLMRERISDAEHSVLMNKMRTTVTNVMKNNRTYSSWAAASSLTQPLSKLPIMHPNSKARTVWVVLCLILIMYDLVIVPMDTFFDIEGDTSSSDNGFRFMSLISSMFWSLDIVANLRTGTYIAGVLVMEPFAIALAYAKSWLIFDVCLMFAGWLTALLHGATSVQALRGLRFLRLLRVLRLGRLQLALEDILDVPHEGVIVCGAMLKIVFGLMLMIHVVGCAWYGVGRISDDGWAHDPAVVSNSMFHNYLLSVHWVASQVHGTSQPMPVTTLEHSFADLLLLAGFCLFVFVVANGTLTVLHFSKVDRWKTQAACARFCDSHNISQTLSARIQHHLALRHRRGGISDKVQQDAELLSALPPSVRADAIDEARWPLLEKLQVFALLQNINARTVRTLCQDAISVSVVLEQGLVFEYRDPGKSVFIIQFGEFLYQFKGIKTKNRASKSSATSGFSELGADWRRKLSNLKMLPSPALTSGNYVSAAVLWTKWEHAGELLALRDSTTLVLSPEIFTDIVRERPHLLDIVASYASAYVQRLNQAELATDLFDFELDIDAIDEIDNPMSDRHLIFLSHYKAEAGTEATLMKDSLTNLIYDDGNNPAIYFHTPVFLDSANLQDLSLLRDAVSNSDNLVLLLTPGVLTRPWCLVEIVTALNENVRVVPVEVQRPGISFEYPDESFYNQLIMGNLLSKEDEQLLFSEGVDLSDVERGLRQVFTQIAMPFSPHKSIQVRQAELSDILNRCSGSTAFDVVKTLSATSAVHSLL